MKRYNTYDASIKVIKQVHKTFKSQFIIYITKAITSAKLTWK